MPCPWLLLLLRTYSFASFSTSRHDLLCFALWRWWFLWCSEKPSASKKELGARKSAGFCKRLGILGALDFHIKSPYRFYICTTHYSNNCMKKAHESGRAWYDLCATCATLDRAEFGRLTRAVSHTKSEHELFRFIFHRSKEAIRPWPAPSKRTFASNCSDDK
jgi:hypothetical protein